jgi:hypothetical protein
MIPDRYVWLVWSSALLVPWTILYIVSPKRRTMMRLVSLFTLPFGLTEVLFVPRYWNPPSLFDLAQKTGFDIESLIFCFAIGGVGAVMYDALTGQNPKALASGEKQRPGHRLHPAAIAAPFVLFVAAALTGWNPIYPGILAMAGGAITAILCRPDLKKRSWIGGLLFLGYYIVFLQLLRGLSPGYVERVWNLSVLSGIRWLGMPLEELLFAFSFGMYWSGVYEHVAWMDTDQGGEKKAGSELHLTEEKRR